jgi:hypothetical protein
MPPVARLGRPLGPEQAGFLVLTVPLAVAATALAVRPDRAPDEVISEARRIWRISSS